MSKNSQSGSSGGSRGPEDGQGGSTGKGGRRGKPALRSRGMKGPSSARPTRSRGTRSHGATATPRKPGANRGGSRRGGRQPWVWGHHAVAALLANPRRTVHDLVVTPAGLDRLGGLAEAHGPRVAEPRELDALLPPGAVHQGLAAHAAPLEWPALEDLAGATDLVLVLDQITDPHNVGAMLRLASAFGVGALVMQDRHAPPLAGATAKVAAGCVETVPVALVTNVANTLGDLKALGFHVVGLAGETEASLRDALEGGGRYALVMGAEGPGLRPRVAGACDALARIPMRSDGAPGTAESLNVATAAAVALYEVRR